MGEKTAKAEAPKFRVGDKVKFKTGRSGTEFVAEVTGHDGQFVVTKDANGNVRKVRGPQPA